MSEFPEPSKESNSTAQRRRMSIADVFSQRPTRGSTGSSPPAGVPANPDAPAPRRGVSISTLGLAGTGNVQSSPYDAFARQRRASIATSTASSSPEFRNGFGDENAVIEEDEAVPASYGTSGSPSFARRMSFGAQALRDARQSSAPNAGEGFNWSEALRKRSPSLSSGNPFMSGHNRTKSLGQPAPAAAPPKEMPKAPASPSRSKKPDHLGERMLRGDFMMD